MHEDRVVAITVTYNRPQTLKHCLDALEKQSRRPDQVIVVDNCSTPEHKAEVRKLTEGRADTTVLWLNENLGGAGGFEAGVRAVRDAGDADWYWLMDDDAYPRPDCLKQLLDAAEGKENAGCMAPVIFGVDLKEYQMYHHKRLSPVALKDSSVADSYEKLEALTRLEANAFVGPLIAKRAADLVGVPDGSLFIYGDDTEYTYRISRAMDIYLVKAAVIDHQDPPVKDNFMDPAGWWKEYYRVRNRFFFYREFHKNRLIHLAAEVYMITMALRLMAAGLLKEKYRGVRRLRVWVYAKAVADGLGNKRGRRVDPEQYRKFLNQHTKK